MHTYVWKEPLLILEPMYQVGKRKEDNFLICMHLGREMHAPCIPPTYFSCHDASFLGRDFLSYLAHAPHDAWCMHICDARTPRGAEYMHTTEQIHTPEVHVCLLH